MKHELKVSPSNYGRILDGSKTFEYRENEANFQMGDTVVLREWDDEPVNSTSNTPRGFTSSAPLTFKVGYVHALSKGEAIFSLISIDEPGSGAPEEPPKKPKGRKR